MSIRVMAEIWDNGPTEKTDLLVLLALADYANDEGKSWPSIGSIAAKSRLTDRGVRKVLNRLETEGWVKISRGNGRNNTNVYHVINPEHRSPLNTVQPEHGSPETLNTGALNPEHGSAKPIEPPLEPSINRDAREIRELLMAWASAEAADSFIRYRRKIKKPLTVTAAKRLAKTLNDILSKGGDPDDALGLAEERGWQGLQSDWYFKSRDISDRPQNRPDPALEQIARLAGLGKASGNGGV